MIDNFSIALTHLLMLIAAWRLIGRADLDIDGPSLAAAKSQREKRRRDGDA